MLRKYTRWLLVIVWMFVIFMFSNQPAVVSDDQSGFVLNLFNALGLDLNSLFGEIAEFIVRKAAHFTEYFILYLLLYNALKNEMQAKRTLWTALIITFLYACSDEFHQTFIAGREGRFRDVLIDTYGGAAVMLILYIKNLKSKSRVNNHKFIS